LIAQFIGQVRYRDIRPDKSNLDLQSPERSGWNNTFSHPGKSGFDCGLTLQLGAVHINKIAVYRESACHCLSIVPIEIFGHLHNLVPDRCLVFSVLMVLHDLLPCFKHLKVLASV